MSTSAVLTGLHGGIVEAMRELQENDIDIDHSHDRLAPADFERAEDAFYTLSEFVNATENP
jgi:hypothetical protein